MAKLTAAQRKALPPSAFAYPPTKSRPGKYPIHDANHRKVALREASRSGTFGTKAYVQRRINQRLGRKGKSGIGASKATTSKRKRATRRTKKSR